MIKIEKLSKTFGDKKAVDNIDLEVNAGEIFGFLGPNGAGKTTTIRMMVGMLKADEGRIQIAGEDLKGDGMNIKKLISYVPDSPEVYEKMTGIQYLNFLISVYGISIDDGRQRIEKYSKILEMDQNLMDYISSYSHGMKQKICLIGALLHEPEVLILDEPMVGLDPKSSFALKEIMRERCERGKTVFFSTHIMEVAEKLCHRIAIINGGKILIVGSMEEISKIADEGDSLEKIFLELTE